MGTIELSSLEIMFLTDGMSIDDLACLSQIVEHMFSSFSVRRSMIKWLSHEVDF